MLCYVLKMYSKTPIVGTIMLCFNAEKLTRVSENLGFCRSMQSYSTNIITLFTPDLFV